MTEQSLPPGSASAATRECDVLVIGGGPAGCHRGGAAGGAGHRVTILEKGHHPRFHIGESLLPANLPLFEHLGVRRSHRGHRDARSGAPNSSRPGTPTQSQTFEFADAWDKSMPFAYQVRRSEFDEILIRNAGRLGAEVIEGCRVREVAFRPDHSGATVHAQHDDGRLRVWRARFVVDASGRDTVLGNRFDSKRRNPSTTVARCTRTSPGPPGTRGATKATSPSSGSSTAGSG